MSMMVSFVLSFFPRDVLDEILNLIESVSEDFPSYSCGTPEETSVQFEFTPFMTTACFLFSKNSLIHFSVSPLIP